MFEVMDEVPEQRVSLSRKRSTGSSHKFTKPLLDISSWRVERQAELDLLEKETISVNAKAVLLEGKLMVLNQEKEEIGNNIADEMTKRLACMERLRDLRESMNAATKREDELARTYSENVAFRDMLKGGKTELSDSLKKLGNMIATYADDHHKELRNLQEQLSLLEKEETDKRKVLVALESEKRALAVDADNLRETSRKKTGALDRTQRACDELCLEKDAVTVQIQEVGREIHLLQQEKERCLEHTGQYKDKITGASNALELVEQELTEAGSKLEMITNERENDQNHYSELSAVYEENISVKEEAVQHLQQGILEAAKVSAETVERGAALSILINERENDFLTLDAKVAKVKEEQNELKIKLSEMEQTLSANLNLAENNGIEWEKELADLEDELEKSGSLRMQLEKEIQGLRDTEEQLNAALKIEQETLLALPAKRMPPPKPRKLAPTKRNRPGSGQEGRNLSQLSEESSDDDSNVSLHLPMRKTGPNPVSLRREDHSVSQPKPKRHISKAASDKSELLASLDDF